jgi:hypothetical protein
MVSNLTTQAFQPGIWQAVSIGIQRLAPTILLVGRQAEQWKADGHGGKGLAQPVPDRLEISTLSIPITLSVIMSCAIATSLSPIPLSYFPTPMCEMQYCLATCLTHTGHGATIHMQYKPRL